MMKRSRFTEERIIVILREQESGVKAADVCRKHGISGAIFHNSCHRVRERGFFRCE